MASFFGYSLVTAGPSSSHDVEATYETVEKIQSLDTNENVFDDYDAR